MSGEQINLNSPKQLGEMLFERMKLPAPKKTQRGYSTSAEVLEQLAPEYPICAKILDYRKVQKLESTYIHSLLEKWAQGKASPELLRAEYPAGYDAAVSAPLPEGKELDYFERGLAYFSGFRGVLARHSPKVLMAEQTLSAQSPRAPYVGVLDLVLELKDGRRALVDHKSSLKASFYGAKGRERRRQLYLYAWLLKENFGFVPEVLCFNLFREKKELSFDFSETEYQETLLLNDYWILKGISYSVLLSKEDREQLEPFREQVLADLEGRWDFSQEDLKKFEEEVKSNYGYPKYETCEAYIKKWMKGK